MAVWANQTRRLRNIRFQRIFPGELNTFFLNGPMKRILYKILFQLYA